MPDLINKLSTYASLVGVVCAIGGGFYAWGEFQTRLNALESVSYESTDLSGINDDIKELNEKINNRVNALGASQEEDYQELKEEIDGLKKDVAINGAAIEYLDAKINELKAANDNPLLN
jgi:chromosome segregation ATPase